jgi:AP-2 complex subunit beta-1
MGKALADSPALNAHSRAVLVALAQPSLPPMPVKIAGPGPVERSSSAANSQSLADKPAPPTPTTQEGELDDEGDHEGGDGDHEDDEDEGPAGRGERAALALDPYANLDSAFGAVDQPQTHRSRMDDDDLI